MCVRAQCWLLATPCPVARLAPLSMGFSSQEYWSGLHFLLQGNFPTQGWNLGSPAGGFFTTEWPVHTSFPDSSVGTESAYSQCRRPRFDSWVRTICWRGDGLPIPVFLGFACGSAGKESTCQRRRHRRCGFNACVGKIPWRRKWQPLQYSCVKNPMDRGAWQTIVQKVAKSQTGLSD